MMFREQTGQLDFLNLSTLEAYQVGTEFICWNTSLNQKLFNVFMWVCMVTDRRFSQAAFTSFWWQVLLFQTAASLWQEIQETPLYSAAGSLKLLLF